MDKFRGFGLIRRPPDENKWIVLVITGRNGTIHGTTSPTGPYCVKLKELQHLGYHTNLVGIIPNLIKIMVYTEIIEKDSGVTTS